MINEAVQSFLDAIKKSVADGFSWLFAPITWLLDWWPLMGHFVVFAAVLLLCGFIARFLPDRVKVWLLVLLGFAVAFIAGEVNQYRKRLAADRARRAAEKSIPKPQPREPTDDQGARWNPFGKW